MPTPIPPELAATWAPAVQGLAHAEAAMPGARLLAVGAAALVGLLLLRLAPADRRGPLGKLVLVAAALRLLLPDALLHIQNDDLALVAVAAGAPIDRLPASHSAHGLLLPLLRLAPGVLGTGIAAATGVSRFFGVLLPLLGALLAWRHGGRAPGLLVGVLLLFSPIAWPYSSAVTAYLPAGVGATLALWAGAAALDDRRPLLGLLAVGGLAFAVGLKPEFVLLLPTVGLALAWGRGRWALAVLLGVAAASAVLLLPGYADSFTANAGGRTERVDAAFLARKLLDWGVFGWLLITPPVLPLKLAFLQGVRRNPPLAVFVLLWSALYLLSESSWGLNQGRHALIYAAPLLAVAAPVLVGWGSRRGLLILFVVLQLAAFGRIGAALVAPEQAAITALRARPPRSDTLILYARHGQDMDPLPLLEAAGVGDVLALDQVAPPGCAEGAALRRVGIRAQAVDLARKRGLGEAGLQRVVDLSRDLLALEAGPAAEEAAALRLQSDRLRSFANPRRCAEQAPAVEALLAPYSQVLLFVDPAPLDGRSAFEAFAARHLDSVVFPPEFNRWEPFELASAWIDVPELTRVPGLYAVRSIALPSVGAQLWAPPDPPIAR